MDPRVREVLIASLIAAAVFIFTAGLDTPDGDIESCNKSYNVIEEKIFTSEQIRFNMELYEQHCIGQQKSLIDDRTFHGTRDTDSLSLSADGAAAANLIRKQHARASACDQFERCLRESRRIVVSTGGFFKRLLLWGAIGFVGVIAVAGTRRVTFLGPFIPMAIALLAIAAITVYRYWGEPDSGTALSVFVAAGAFALMIMTLIAISTSPPSGAPIPVYIPDRDDSDSRLRGIALARAIVIGAGRASQTLRRGEKVTKSSELGSIGLVDSEGNIAPTILEKWATVISGEAGEHTRLSTGAVNARLIEAISTASRNKAGGLAKVKLAEIALEFLKLLRVKEAEYRVITLGSEYRLPAAFLLRLDFESDEDFKIAKERSYLFSQSQSQTEALKSLIPGDQLIVATKKNFIVGLGTIPPYAESSEIQIEHYDQTRKIVWTRLTDDPTNPIAISSIHGILKCPKSPQRTITELDWDRYLAVTRSI